MVNKRRDTTSQASEFSNILQGIPCPGSFEDILVDVEEIACRCGLQMPAGGIISSTPKSHPLVGMPFLEFEDTGGSHFSHTVVKPDSHLAQIFCKNFSSIFLYNSM